MPEPATRSKLFSWIDLRIGGAVRAGCHVDTPLVRRSPPSAILTDKTRDSPRFSKRVVRSIRGTREAGGNALARGEAGRTGDRNGDGDGRKKTQGLSLVSHFRRRLCLEIML